MSNSPDFVNHCLELLAPLGAVRARRMFGGHGLYVDELFIAIVASERLFLKVDEVSRSAFEAAGCGPFTYATKQGETGVMSYFNAPDEAIESPMLMQPWARLALAAALRARSAMASKTLAAAAKKAARKVAKKVAKTVAKKAARPARTPS
ncbi:TfoX/Sxy family protein [Sphaerotilus mobilis]|uniref:DNA transformation protein n=1 Tax=Sphaerotilus mobilis TaxID=47994 RepID=A0A4Q7LMU7_9BURK|nr:TfoX/Sxy family protein [Sphaerotilus mobilis]RZS54879.1 DNA transformation protein [Sphaerotilus mobilis]